MASVAVGCIASIGLSGSVDTLTLPSRPDASGAMARSGGEEARAAHRTLPRASTVAHSAQPVRQAQAASTVT